MRSQKTLSNLRAVPHGLRLIRGPASRPQSILPSTSVTSHRTLAQVRPDQDLPELWFTSTRPPVSVLKQTYPPGPSAEKDRPPLDERTLKLGKSTPTPLAYHPHHPQHLQADAEQLSALRILQARLPTLLASPLPPEILSPHISLHLFPTTHPHLPTVSGRVAYHAALWTAPMAWGRVPIVGNVKLIILSEKVVPSAASGGASYTFTHNENRSKPVKPGNERLIVRWKTCGKTKGKGMGALYRGIGAREQVDKITEWLGGDARDDEEFCGLFIFEFDEDGRVLSHTIEHAEEDGLWEGRVGKVVSITEWLLGRVKGRGGKEMEVALGLGFDGGRREEGRRECGE